MPRIVCEVHPDQHAMEQLERLCPGGVQSIPFHEHRWEMLAELLPGPEILLCKLPPRNLDALDGLKLIQIATVGYEHLRELHFADRSIRVCNARGIFDTAIAEWNVAM